MNQPNQSQQDLNQLNKNQAVKGRESFDKNDQSQKYNASKANEKASESYSPNKKQNQNEEEQIDDSGAI